MLKISKYTFGVGDRFAHQAKAQLQACIQAAAEGAEVVPVWNKSYREHSTVGSSPDSVREAADAAVQSLGWDKPYHVDADHINLDNVDGFLASSDFFTIDVADAIGEPASRDDAKALIDRYPQLIGTVSIPGIDQPLEVSREAAERIARQYLLAAQEAGAIYRHIASEKGAENFITEVSMDETDQPQTPPELLIILAALADQQIPLQTIAPKFTGRFNKGVDYVGDVEQFEQEFSDDLAVIAYAIKEFGLPDTLKLSVHSGSDKFSIYGPIRRSIEKFDAGLHIKTAGTNWLEEVIGLADAGGEGLEMAKEIYIRALAKKDELCAPYATVIDIDGEKLPSADEVKGWSSQQYVAALRHDQSNPEYNPHLRQLIHVGYKIAAQLGDAYLEMLVKFEPTVSKNVTENLYERHLKPLFLDSE